MTIKVTKKKLEQALETYAGLVEAYPDNEDYLQRYAEMLQSLGREATATVTLQHLHDVIAKRSEKEAKIFAKKHPQIGRISLEEVFDAQDSHSITGQIIYELLGKLWLKLHQKKLKEGQVVCKAGDNSDSLVLVLQGSVDIYAPDSFGNRILLEKVGLYDILGEQNFLRPGPLSFDAFVSSESAVIVKIPREKIQQMVATNNHLTQSLTQRAQFRTYVRMIALHPIFKTLPLKLSKYLARHVSKKHFPAKTMILSLEQAVDGIHIILSGKASYLAKKQDGKKFALEPLVKGTLVGDLLLKGKAVQKNELFASTDVQTIFIPDAQLINISTAFPPLMERLMQHAEKQQQQIVQSLSQLKNA